MGNGSFEFVGDIFVFRGSRAPSRRHIRSLFKVRANFTITEVLWFFFVLSLSGVEVDRVAIKCPQVD